MAEALKEFTDKYNKYDARIVDIMHGWSMAATSMANLELLTRGTVREIAAVVHKLKDGGRSGEAITAFLDDKDVKALYEGLNKHFNVMKTHHATIEKQKIEAKAVYAKVISLQAEVDKEAKSLKRAVVGSKSVVGMTELSTKITKDMAEAIPKFETNFAGLVAKECNAQNFKKDTEDVTALNLLIRKSKTNLEEKEADIALQHSLNIRLVTGKRNAALLLSKSVTDHAKNVVTAVREGRKSDAMGALALGANAVKEIQQIHAPLLDAFEQFIKGRDAEKSDDGQKVKKMIEDLDKIERAAQRDLGIGKKAMGM